MAGIMTFLTVGILVFMICYLKFQSDLKFSTVMKFVIRLRVITPLKNEWKRWKYCVRRQLDWLTCGRWDEDSWKPKPKYHKFKFTVEDFGGNRKWNIFRLRLREAIRARRRRKHEKALLDALAGAP